MGENFLHHRCLLVQFTVMPPAVDIIADEPTHGRTRHHIAREVLPRSDSRDHHCGSQSVRQDRYNQGVPVLVRNHRRQCPRIDGMPRRKAGIPSAAGTVPKMTLAVGFSGPRAIGGDLDRLHDQVAVDQCLKSNQARFAESLYVLTGSDEVKAGTDRNQRICRAEARRVPFRPACSRRAGGQFITAAL